MSVNLDQTTLIRRAGGELARDELMRILAPDNLGSGHRPSSEGSFARLHVSDGCFMREVEKGPDLFSSQGDSEPPIP